MTGEIGDAMDVVEVARAALERGDWGAAQAGFEQAAECEVTGKVLEGLSQALFCQGEYAAALEHRERVFVLFRAGGEDAQAAKTAAWLSQQHGAIYRNDAARNGWLARAETLMHGLGDCPERAWVELAAAVAPFDPEEDPTGREDHLEKAVEIARRHGESAVEFEALAIRGTVLVYSGELETGMRLIDEALTAAVGGEVKDLVAVSDMYCWMLGACELANDVRRAKQWLELAERVAQRTPFVPVGPSCHAVYGGILTAAGRWEDAEREFGAALDLSSDRYRALRADAHVRLALLRIRQGELERAAHLLADAEQDLFAARAEIELHLARGEAELAAVRARTCLREWPEVDLIAPLLMLLVRAELAEGDVTAASAALARMQVLAAQSTNRVVHALWRYGAGLVAGATGDRGAITDLEAAARAFRRLALPHEEGATRLALAEVHAKTHPVVAVTEARIAFDLFRSLPAPRDADAALSLLRRLGVRGHAGPRGDGTLTRREREVLVLLGAGLSNDQIATRLYISRRTVEHHVSNVLAKLGLSNRTEAAAFVSRRTST